MPALCDKFRKFCWLLLRPVATADRQLIIILAVPILTFFVVSTIQLVGTKREMEELDLLIELSAKLSDFMHETQKERGATGLFTGSRGEQFRRSMLIERETTNVFRRKVLDFVATSQDKISRCKCLRGLQSVLNSTEFRSVVTFMNGLDKHRDLVLLLQIGSDDAVDYYTAMHRHIFNTFARIQQRAHHPQLKDLLMEYFSLASAKENAGLERGVGSQAFGAGAWPSSSRHLYYIEITATLATHLQTFRTFASADHLRFWDETMDSSVEALAYTADMRDILVSRTDEIQTVDPGWWFWNMTEKIDTMKQVETHITNDLQTQVDEVAQAARRRMMLYLCALVLAVLVIGAFAVRLYLAVRRMQRDVERAHEVAEAIAKMQVRDLSDTLPSNASALQTVMHKVVLVVQSFLPYLPETALAVTSAEESTDERNGGDDTNNSNEGDPALHFNPLDASNAEPQSTASAFRTVASPPRPGSFQAHIVNTPSIIPRRGISVLVADMQGFNMSTLQKDRNISVIHTAYVTSLESHIRRCKGLMLPFQGDKVLACWNAMSDLPSHTVCAARAALACRAEIRCLREKFARFPPVGIAADTGVVRAGNMGSPTTQVFTLLGPVVNSALFLAKLNGRLGTKILVGPSLMTSCMYRFLFRLVDRVEFGGSDMMTKNGSMFEVYELLDENPDGGGGEWLYGMETPDCYRGYTVALEHFFRHRIDEAVDAVRAHLATFPEDEVAASLLNRLMKPELQKLVTDDSDCSAISDVAFIRRWCGWDNGQWVKSTSRFNSTIVLPSASSHPGSVMESPTPTTTTTTAD
eukprot:NODE_79_length_2577_cov_118.793513_g60_i0.p1 GENE.NODE_79_length_2577_cov_118.793513_g60_i0~~NODE_79_length_2577_cov_118.793513_g60_i0.p1  ORF type:complete len:808 (+),score=170.96 NODE_79_length_2577_cov_118.793513_g60_i0:51-2474(+)